MVLFKYKNRKSQSTPEVMLGVGIIMFLFLLVAVFTLNHQIKLGETEDYIEKRSECLKIVNLINSVYISGPGTEVETHTDFLITAFNGSMVSVETLNSVEEYGDVPRIAFLASESGPTLQSFYDRVNLELDPDPDWYKNCFSDIGVSGCDQTPWMNTRINRTIHDLMNNLDNYNTIYLEDATLNYDHYATDYINRLEDWVSEGNALILSEHVFCSESTYGPFSNTSYRCENALPLDNDWEMFGINLHQRFSDYYYFPSHQYNVVVENTNEAFDLAIGDQLSFEERPYVNNDVSTTGYEAESLSLNGGYYSSSVCSCSSPSAGRCARNTGTSGTQANISLNNFPETTGEYEITIRYCDETDDSGNPDDYSFYINGNLNHTWQSTNGYGSGEIWREETFNLNLNSGDNLKISGIRSSNTGTRVDWIDLNPLSEGLDNEFTVIARYRNSSYMSDSRNQPAIAYWNYGEGKIFYFGDFYVNYINIPTKQFSQVLVDLISVAYYMVAHPERESDITCHFSAFAPYQQVFGDIKIKNENNYIILENVNETQ
nr:hypothetical protein [Nanoarchaeum sp.]